MTAIASQLPELERALKHFERDIRGLAAERESRIRTLAQKQASRERKAMSRISTMMAELNMLEDKIRASQRQNAVRVFPLWPFSECRVLLQILAMVVIPLVCLAAYLSYTAWNHKSLKMAVRRETMFSSDGVGDLPDSPTTRGLVMRKRSTGSMSSGGFSHRLSISASTGHGARSPVLGADSNGTTPRTPRFEL